MAGITMSPQFRESPEIGNVHEAAFGAATARLLIATNSRFSCSSEAQRRKWRVAKVE